MAQRDLVAVGMSGGVDSSAAALLLLSQGRRAIGVTMRVWPGGEGPARTGRHGCYGPDEEEIAEARRVAGLLGIEHHVIDLRPEFAHQVLEPLRAEYAAGRTPNPCVRCNPLLKFGVLAERAAERFGARWFATGHYARVEIDTATGLYLLRRGRSPKDQSYFLAFLSQAQLARALFPLGSLDKAEVRRLAAPLGLESAAESQDFAGRGGRDLLAGRGAGPGPIKDLLGARLGTHPGIQFFTVGQRRGLGLPGRRPLHVLRIDPAENALIVGDKELLLARELGASSVSWIDGTGPQTRIAALVQIRHRHPAAPATIAPAGPRSVRVHFQSPQSAIAPGQAAVFYSGDRVLGGGIIDA